MGSPLQQIFDQRPQYRGVPLPEAQPWLEAIETQSAELGLDPRIARALLFAEAGGGYPPSSFASSRGAQGPWQLTPAVPHVDPHNPELATHGALTYLKQLLSRFPNVHDAIAAYNRGPTAQRRTPDPSQYPLETQRHLARFKEHYGR